MPSRSVTRRASFHGLAIGILVALILLPACGGRQKLSHRPGEVVVIKHGPPPHAPAHGYRHKHEGGELRYDTSLGVYVVLGHRHCYYHRDRYLRRTDSGWQVSLSIAGPWQVYATRSLPPGLAKKYGHEAPKKGAKKK